MVFFRAAHGWGRVKKTFLPKIYHTYPIMMKLTAVIPYIQKIQKIYKSHDTPLEFCWYQHFFTGIQQLLLYKKKYRYRLHFNTQFLILLAFLESLKVVLINMVEILMISAKLATLGLLKIKVFWSKDYDDIIFVHGITNNILSRDTNNIVNVVLWPKHFYERGYHNLNFIRIWPEKPVFLRGVLGSSSIIWDCH